MSNLNIMKVKKLSKTAVIPYKAHKDDAGFDVFASKSVMAKPFSTVKVPLGIAIQLPKDYYADLRPRSGMTFSTPLKGHLGTIDNGYRGEIQVMFTNVSDGNYWISVGEKIGQLVIHRLPEFKAVEVDELSETDRGENGFGSTGK